MNKKKADSLRLHERKVNMYRELLENGAYDSASEYDQLLAFARDEFDEEVAEEIARKEYECETEREE